MSYWGAQVIISLFDAIPLVGPALSEWIRGDFVVSDATLNRFFSLHVIAVPLVLALLVFLHIVALHKVGSNNPDGIEIKKTKGANGLPLDGIPFHPYYTVKDTFGTVMFLIAFCAVMFFAPEMYGWFLEHDNFVPANILNTPPEIKPLWYFTPFYSILRAIPPLFNSQFPGVLAMGIATMILFFLPWLDRSPVKSIRYRGAYYKWALATFVVVFIVLGYLGVKPTTVWGQFKDPWDVLDTKDIATWVARVCTILYFAFFFLMPWYTARDKVQPVPQRVTV
jgi:ubiquinol-cytochrome c reductase cytochrome b subunit